MEIRQYRTSDLDACRALWTQMTKHHQDIYGDPTIGGDDPGLEFDSHLEQVGDERVWVATSDEKVLGFTSLIADGEQAEVEPIVVAEGQRGKGIGQALVKRAIEEAKLLGVLCLSAKPVARNKQAVSFFYEAGFKNLGHVHMFMWLGPSSPDQWKRGPTLFGHEFNY
ncbi:MAG: GNAT family N-acetyltransferase [Planctomycetota bacterium]|jgi:GNAT superfamily N-acetyltransferase